MTTALRDMRRCAVQVLYQLDMGRSDSLETIRESLDDSPGGEAAHERGYDMALLAWEFRDDADRAVAALAPDWPTHRQPVVDRAILRLAWYEMHHSDTPPKVAINEAVELAREFGTDKSYLFINGVLDKFLRALREPTGPTTDAEPT